MGCERPILFSAPMVRAILAGTKTQTRRVVKPAGKDDAFALVDYGEGWRPYRSDDGESSIRADGNETPIPCPYGKVGDRLWVRETWQAVNGNDRARHIVAHPAPDRGWVEYAATPRTDEPAYKWRPSIHMPRWACRITLEITAVHVERLQDISEADAVAEGISEFIGGWWCKYDDAKQIAGNTPQDGYRHLWERINGPGSWATNPWVWTVEFSRIEPSTHQGGAA